MIIAFDLIKKLADGKFHSGQQLAQELKINRAHIWRAVAYLKALKLEIYAVRGKGYKLASPIELLNETHIRQNLTAKTASSLNLLQILSVTHSTNDYVKEHKRRNLPPQCVVVAEAQTQGRGRAGRKWFSPFGANIYLSLFWKLKANLSGLSLVVGLAVAKSLEELGLTVKVKWPNDIYYENKKMVGILIESDFKPGAEQQNVFIGIGVNVNLQSACCDVFSTDLELKQIITDLNTVLGFTPSRNEFIGRMLNNIVEFLEKFEGNGFKHFLPLWEKYDYLMDKLVSVIKPLSTQNRMGQVKGVSQRGELLLLEEGVLKALCVGDIKIREN